jgi:hypothetical protein
MAELKTKETGASVSKFINAVPDATKRKDSLKLIEMMKKATGAKPKMWGPSIIGFGKTHLVYDSGRELDMPLVGFSPRKQALTLYLNVGSPGYKDLLTRLGKHTTSKACLYIKRLDDVDLKVLQKMIDQSVKVAPTGRAQK